MRSTRLLAAQWIRPTATIARHELARRDDQLPIARSGSLAAEQREQPARCRSVPRPVPSYTGAVNGWPSGNYACWLVLDADASAATYKDQWQTLCAVTITDNLGGIFPLQVKSSNIPGVDRCR